MSNLEAETPAENLDRVKFAHTAPLLLEPRSVKLTTRLGVTIKRSLPHKALKKIGAWCFLDSYAPTTEANAMQVAAHPHTGLQTVTWLFSGTVLHHDSLGSKATIRPGQLNLMTAGHGIAHSEISIENDEPLQGVQLWVVLPEVSRCDAPSFEHHGDLPRTTDLGAEITVFMGELLSMRSPAKTFSPIVGAEVSLQEQSVTIPLNGDWEHAILAVSDIARVEETQLRRDQLLYLPPGRSSVTIAKDASTSDPTRVILIGGQRFEEKFVMWWNFIGRSHDEIVQMRDDWESHNNRFPEFADSIHGRIPAPEMPNLRLAPR